MERRKPLAYTSLCRPLLKYGDWDPSDAIKMVQNCTICFIKKNLKGRREISEARNHVELQTLKLLRFSLLMRVLRQHQTPILSFHI